MGMGDLAWEDRQGVPGGREAGLKLGFHDLTCMGGGSCFALVEVVVGGSSGCS